MESFSKTAFGTKTKQFVSIKTHLLMTELSKPFFALQRLDGTITSNRKGLVDNIFINEIVDVINRNQIGTSNNLCRRQTTSIKNQLENDEFE